MFRETTGMGLVMEEEEQVKLKYGTTVPTSGKSSQKSTNATWLRFFSEGNSKDEDLAQAQSLGVEVAEYKMICQ